MSELREAALRILTDPSARDIYSKNSVAAAQQLSWDNIAQQYMKIYSEVIRGSEKLHALAK
jgi:glycosyltransferase involved in cell wall biosynthesis